MATIDRRGFIHLSGLGVIATSIPSFPKLSFAQVATEQRMLVIILRGGMDGLAAVPAIGDKNYIKQRKNLALNNALKLDGFFALHPKLKTLHDLYHKKELAIFHTIATPYRERSHFDAQNILENGTDQANKTNDGWLNRLIANIPNNNQNLGLAIGQNIPLILYGKQPVASWTPSNRELPDEFLLQQIKYIYRKDKKLYDALIQGLAIHKLADSASKKSNTKNIAKETLEVAAELLLNPKGARIATIELSGWDTHAQQGTENGALANNFRKLSDAISIFRKKLDPIWDKTTVIIVTEFGRTVAENGTGGTDHGTGSVAFLLGGNVKGRRIYTKWQGLDRYHLYQGRDLMPIFDIRSLFKTVVYNKFNIPLAQLNHDIFPDSRLSAPILKDIMR